MVTSYEARYMITGYRLMGAVSTGTSYKDTLEQASAEANRHFSRYGCSRVVVIDIATRSKCELLAIGELIAFA